MDSWHESGFASGKLADVQNRRTGVSWIRARPAKGLAGIQTGMRNTAITGGKGSHFGHDLAWIGIIPSWIRSRIDLATAFSYDAFCKIGSYCPVSSGFPTGWNSLTYHLYTSLGAGKGAGFFCEGNPR